MHIDCLAAQDRRGGTYLVEGIYVLADCNYIAWGWHVAHWDHEEHSVRARTHGHTKHARMCTQYSPVQRQNMENKNHDDEHMMVWHCLHTPSILPIWLCVQMPPPTSLYWAVQRITCSPSTIMNMTCNMDTDTHRTNTDRLPFGSDEWEEVSYVLNCKRMG